MKHKYTATEIPNNTGHHNSRKQHHTGNLDRLAHDIDALSRSFLRDGVLGGVLAGNEAEIRQDAIQLALQWTLRGSSETGAAKEQPVNNPDNLPRTVAQALRITKMRLARHLTKEGKARLGFMDANGGVALHQSDVPPWDWPYTIRLSMALRGLQLAARTGQISQANVCVARLILEGRMTAPQVAKRLNVTRGAINQQLWRVRKALPAVIATMEFPL